MADLISEIVKTMEHSKADKLAANFALSDTIAFFLTMIDHIKAKSPPERLSAAYAEVAKTFARLDMNDHEIKQAHDNMTRVYELCKVYAVQSHTQSVVAPGGD